MGNQVKGVEVMAYDIGSASLNQSKDISSNVGDAEGIAFNDDGTKMYVADDSPPPHGINEYDLSIAFDVSTASFTQFFETAQGSLYDIDFNSDGTKMLIIDRTQVFSYNLSNAYDISTATYNQDLDVSSNTDDAFDLAFNNDGTKMFVNSSGTSEIVEYSLSTGFDISTASFNQALDVSNNTSEIDGLAFNDDGTKMFITDEDFDEVLQYGLSTGFDVSTASFTKSLDVFAEDTTPEDVDFNNDGSKMYVSGEDTTTIYEYDLGSGSGGGSGASSVTDYNKKKKLEVTSQNDSGTTQDKAQPVTIPGEINSVTDGFEDGSISDDWENYRGGGEDTTVQSTVVKNGSNAVSLSDGRDSWQFRNRFGIDLDGNSFSAWMRTDTQDFYALQYGNTDADLNSEAVKLQTNDSGSWDVKSYDSSGSSIDSSTFGSYSTGNWYRAELTFDVANSNVTAKIYDDTDTQIASTTINYDGSSEYKFCKIADYGGTGQTVYYDDVYISDSIYTESKTGTGNIVIDFTNIAGPQDIAVYDQNGNLLDYEIEELDTTKNTAVLWAYNSWIRDDSVQAQIAYGDNSANEDRSVAGTGSNPWDNTGQNTLWVHHFEESNADETTGTIVDSTVNDYDGTINGAASTTTDLNGALDFDGTDDWVEGMPYTQVYNQDWTLIAHVNPRTIGGGTPRVFFGTEGGEGTVAATNNDSDGDLAEFYTSNNNSSNLVPNTNSQNLVSYRNDDSVNETTFGLGMNFNTLGFSSYQNTGQGTGTYLASLGGGGQFWDGTFSEMRFYEERKSDAFIQAELDAVPQGGQVYFSQQAAQTTQDTNLGPTTTASATGDGETISLSGSTTASTTTGTATGTGATIFIEPDFGTLSATGTGAGSTITISGSTTLDALAGSATATGGTSQLTQILATTTATATGTGSTIQIDRLSGTVDVESQPTSGVDVNVVDKSNNILYETVTDSNGDWIVDSGDGIVYQVAYLFDDGSTYYGDAEESDTT